MGRSTVSGKPPGTDGIRLAVVTSMPPPLAGTMGGWWVVGGVGVGGVGVVRVGGDGLDGVGGCSLVAGG